MTEPPASTYDLATDVGKVRLEIDDSDVAAASFTDAELQVFLTEEGSVLGAAARACEVLARRYARQVDVSSDDQSIKLSQRSAAYAKLAEDLRARVEGQTGIGTIRTEKVDGYNDTGVDNEAIDGAGANGRVRQGYINPDRIP